MRHIQWEINMRYLRNFALVAILFTCMNSFADTADVRSVLFKVLDPVLSEKVDSKIKFIQYCPDNVCLLVEAPIKINSTILYEFTLLFFYYEADFPEFVDEKYPLPTGISPRNEFSKIAPSLLKKYASTSCTGVKNENSCVLKYLRDKYEIKIYFTRFDEGHSAKELLK